MDRCQLPPLGLADLAMRTIAIQLWQQPDIKRQIKDLFLRIVLETKTKNSFIPLFVQTCKVVDSLALETSQKIKLKSIVSEVGVNMFQWLIQFPKNGIDQVKKYNFKGEISNKVIRAYMVDCLQWNSMGFIDTSKTVRSCYYRSRTDKINWEIMLLKFIHVRCLEDCIDHYWSEVHPDQYEKRMNEIFSYDSSLGFIGIYWKCRLASGYLNFKDSKHHVPENIVNSAFLSSLNERNWPANQYFWNKVSDQHKYTSLTNLRCRPVHDMEHSKWTILIDLVGCMKTMASINCLLSKMTGRESRKFSASWRLIILELNMEVLACWQWQHLAISMIKTSWDVIDSDLFYYVVLLILRDKMVSQYKLIGTNKQYHNLIHEIWKDTPKSLKLATHNARRNYFHYIKDVTLLITDVKLTNDMLNDEDLKEAVRQFLDKFHALVDIVGLYERNRDVTFLDNLIKNILLSDGCSNEMKIRPNSCVWYLLRVYYGSDERIPKRYTDTKKIFVMRKST